MTKEYKNKVVKMLMPIAPEWAEEIKKCKLDWMAADRMEEYDKCIVGEAWGFNAKYKINPIIVYECDNCHSFANSLYDDIFHRRGRGEFTITNKWLKIVEDFVKHYNEKHFVK